MNHSFFSGKVAVITGAGGTLCSVIARRLAAEGAVVALLGRTPAALEKVAGEIRANGGIARAYACDVVDRAWLASTASVLNTP